MSYNKENLNYEMDDWIRIDTDETPYDQLVFLPSEEKHIKDEEFIVISEADIENLMERR